MSDGPHRSLNMRPGWKKVAEFADRPAFASAQVSEAAMSAFAEDCRADVPEDLAKSVRDILGGEQDSLFREQPVMQLEALRRMTAGHGLGQILIDCAVQCAASGRSGPDAAAAAAADALAIWGARIGRQIEEHWRRESTERRTQNVRARVESAISGASLLGLARQLLKLDNSPIPRTPSKQTGIDDGVQL